MAEVLKLLEWDLVTPRENETKQRDYLIPLHKTPPYQTKACRHQLQILGVQSDLQKDTRHLGIRILQSRGLYAAHLAPSLLRHRHMNVVRAIKASYTYTAVSNLAPYLH